MIELVDQLLNQPFGTVAVIFVLFMALLEFAAYMTGQAVAVTWKPLWHVPAYCVMLGFADRFLVWGLFGGDGLSLTGYAVDTAILGIFGLFAFQLNRARRVTSQYPWLFERAGLFSWREKR